MGLASDIYAEELWGLGHGHPLWQPNSVRTGVRIGDVGYFMTGGFYRIFNPTVATDDKINRRGAPDNLPSLYLKSQEDSYDADYFRPGLHNGSGIKLKPRIDEDESEPIELQISSKRSQSAFFIAKGTVVRRHTTNELDFKNCLFENHKDWLEYSRGQRRLILDDDELLLVRGWVKTEAWTVGVHLRRQLAGREIDPLGDDGEPINIALKILPAPSSYVVQYRSGPPEMLWGRFDEERACLARLLDPAQQSASSSRNHQDGPVQELVYQAAVSNDPSDSQVEVVGADTSNFSTREPRRDCLFLSYYKMKPRMLIIPKRVVAEGEPQDPRGNTDNDASGSGLSTQSSQPRRRSSAATFRPLDDLLTYILENSDADYAIASDADVYRLVSGHAWPEDFPSFYKNLAPRLYVDDRKLGTLWIPEYLPETLSHDENMDNGTVSQSSVSGNLLLSSRNDLSRNFDSPLPTVDQHAPLWTPSLSGQTASPASVLSSIDIWSPDKSHVCRAVPQSSCRAYHYLFCVTRV
ncbi:unnamed protein product [Somion occarium]|uniref:Uncharacterized protein n=1 Tax=Somion occarium TaxID=3059160 RepID=A0ABP1E413_9APHY